MKAFSGASTRRPCIFNGHSVAGSRFNVKALYVRPPRPRRVPQNGSSGGNGDRVEGHGATIALLQDHSSERAIALAHGQDRSNRRRKFALSSRARRSSYGAHVRPVNFTDSRTRGNPRRRSLVGTARLMEGGGLSHAGLYSTAILIRPLFIQRRSR